MQIMVLVGFVLALTLMEVPSPAAPGWAIASAVGIYLAGAAGLGRYNTAASLRAIRRAAGLNTAILRRHNSDSVLIQCWVLGGLAFVMALGYGQWVMDDLALGRFPLIGKVAVVAPFVGALVLSWTMDYPFGSIVRRQVAEGISPPGPSRAGWTLREYLAYNIRHHLLSIAVPLGLIILAMDVLSLYVHPLLPAEVAEPVLTGGILGTVGLVFLIAPLLIVRIWRTGRLPDGPLRRSLEEMCRRLKFRCRDILIWRSGGVIANAGVMGLVARLRYILLSDAMLEYMDDRHIRAIFAHEAGHVVSHHIFHVAAFAVMTVIFYASAVSWLAATGLLPDWAVQVAALGMLAIAWGFGFGWLSRRFERQSDVIAAWAMSHPSGDSDEAGRITLEGAAIFARALRRVAELNGIPAWQHNWRHGSIALRVGYILQLGAAGGTRRQIDRRIRCIKIALWAGLALAIAVMAVQVAFDG